MLLTFDQECTLLGESAEFIGLIHEKVKQQLNSMGREIVGL